MPNSPISYAAVLRQLALITFGYLCFCFWLLSELEPSLKTNAGPLIEVAFLKISIPAFWLIFALAAALIFRLTKLHDRVSDIVGIRFRYDLKYVLLPLFSGTHIPEDLRTSPKLFANRTKLMRAIFYKYLRPETQNSIPAHFIELAWDSLLWYWAVVEALVITFLFTMFCLLWEAHIKSTLAYCALLLFLFIAYYLSKQSCIRHTTNEVDAILEDQGRKLEITTSINEILH